MSHLIAPRSRVGIVGAGRLGRAVGRTLESAGLELVVAHSRSQEGRRLASEQLQLRATGDPADVLRAAEVVLLCVPDPALPEVVRDLARVDVDPRIVVLMSGAAPLAVLAPLHARGHRVMRVHPLRALTPGARPDELAGAPAAITADDAAGVELGRALAERLGMVPFTIAESQVATWHAAATMAANHTVVLVADARDMAMRLGLERGAALVAFGDLSRQAVARAIDETPERALTGVVSRGDAGALQAHLHALAADFPQLLPAYRELALRTLAVARAGERLAPARQQEVERQLDRARPVVVERATELRQLLAPTSGSGLRVGFVPTMGALHDGHAELIRTARAECDVVVVSCFVNPTQFGPGEDLERYPRTPEDDEQVVRVAGADVLWRPAIADLYGDDPAGATSIRVGALGEVLEGRSRPGHFDGVASVVVRLLGVVQPHALYLGAKDFQQVAVLQSVVRDLAIPVGIRTVDTVREADGLARSSRNAYLSDAERRAARAIPDALDAAHDLLAAGVRSASALRDAVIDRLEEEPLLEIDYVEVVEPETLAPVIELDADAMLLLAARIGTTRLIDNTRLVAARSGVAA